MDGEGGWGEEREEQGEGWGEEREEQGEGWGEERGRSRGRGQAGVGCCSAWTRSMDGE
jgi:hypothetical protein